MAKKSDIQYVVDERGRKKAVIMSYRAYKQLLEDLDDLRCIEERKNEPTICFDEIVEDLKKAGRI